VAAGDFDGDGKADLITGAGPGGGPHVRIFRGATGQPLRDIRAYAPGTRVGVAVAAGDFDGDGKADVVMAPLSGGLPVRVTTVDGLVLKEAVVTVADSPAGARVAVRDVDDDGAAEVLTAATAGGRMKLMALKRQGDPADQGMLDPAAVGGVFVG
jgi:hypothetical protein